MTAAAISPDTLGLIGVVMGAIGVAAFAVLVVLHELRLCSQRRIARERMRSRCSERWPLATGTAGPFRDRPLFKTDLAPRLGNEREGRP